MKLLRLYSARWGATYSRRCAAG